MKNLADPPFALPRESVKTQTVKNDSYFWDNSKRGRKQYVIIHQTISGCGRLRLRGRTSRLQRGSVMIALVPEDSAYFFRAEDAPEWVFRWITFEGDSAMRLWAEMRRRFGPVLHLREEGGAGRALGKLIEDIADRRLSGPQVQAEALHSVFLSSWFEMENHGVGISNPAPRLREMIRARYQEPVNVKQLCAEIGQSREHLTRVFKDTYGFEPARYLRQLRIAAAERYLLRSNLSVAEIAERTGHAGTPQFTRSFIAANGKSPRAFRLR